MGHHVYFDYCYNSPDLIDLLHKRKTHAFGTVRKNWKSLPLAVTQAKLKQGETVFHCKNNLLALKWMDKSEVYILSGLHKATNVIRKKLITKGKRLLNLNQSFCTIGTCQVLIWQINFYSTTVFCIKVSSGQRNSLCTAWTWLYSMHTFSTREIFRQQKMHWQFRIELVKHMLSNAWQQPWGIVPVPDHVDCPFCLVDKHFIEPIPGQEGGRRKHPSCACFVYNVSKEALSDAGFGDSYKPKK